MIRAVVTVGVLLAALTLGAGAAPGPACACSCAAVSAKAKAKYADAVFVGTVHTVRRPSVLRDSSAPTMVSLVVTRVFKGSVRRHTVLSTASAEASCGATFTEGARYLVYAEDATGRSTAAPLTAGLCGVTRLSSDAAVGLGAGRHPEDPVLGGGSAPAAGGRTLPPAAGPGLPVVVGLGAGIVVLLLLLPITLWWRGRRMHADPR